MAARVSSQSVKTRETAGISKTKIFLETYSVLLAPKGVYHMKFERGFEHFSLDMDLDMDAVNVIDFNRDN